MTRAQAPDWLPRELLARNTDPHVVVALSGGVDSSVACLRLREAGLRLP